jgi:hypothetical protein
MKTRAIVLALAAAGLISCRVNNNVSIEPFGVCAPQDDATKCVGSGKCDAWLTGQAHFYPVLGFKSLTPVPTPISNELVFFMEFKNQLPDNTDLSAGRPNTNDAYIEQYELSFAGGGFTIPDVTISTTAPPVPAGGTATPFVTFIPAETSQIISLQMAGAGLTEVLVDVNVKALGHYANGSKFETGGFKLPVIVHAGIFGGFGCPQGEVLVAVCPNIGQTATIKCDKPACALVQAKCTVGADCCSYDCDVANGVCNPGRNTTTCTQGGDCTSGACSFISYTCCGPSGVACATDAECCTGTCNTTTNTCI